MWVVTEAKMRVSSGTRNSWNDSNESSNDHIPLGRVVTQVKMCNGAVMPAAVRTKAGLMLLMCWYSTLSVPAMGVRVGPRGGIQ